MKPIFTVSLMCMNLMKLSEQLDVINKNASMVHVDIMDGHFVPNLTLSPYFVKSIREDCKVPMDCHLMVTNPDLYVKALAEAGADYIVPHAEVINSQAFRIIDMIHSYGVKAGVAINPATPVSYIETYLNRLEMVTVMSVDPGFAGQKFVPEVLGKITQLKELREKHGYNYFIEVDGSCNKNTYKRFDDAGVDAYVLGSTGLFNNDPDLSKAWAMMEKEYKEALSL